MVAAFYEQKGGNMRDRWRADLSRFQEEVNKVVEQSLNRIGNYWAADGVIRPAADIYEQEEQLVVFVELPGVAKDDVNVAITGRSLTISAEKKRPDIEEEFLRQGARHFGPCKHSFDLNCDVNVDAIEATFTDGVLKLTIPKVENKTQKIEIKIG